MGDSRPAKERFWANIIKQEHRADACWAWTGSSFRIRVEGRLWMVKRYSYFLYHHEDPGDGFVVASCGNTYCVRPTHLERLSTMGGSLHPRAKLTESDIVVIYQALRDKTATGQELAERYDVSPSVVSEVARYKSWKHVTRPVIVREPAPVSSSSGKRMFEAEDIREIRRKREEEGALVESLGEEYGVNPSFISAICNYRAYKDIE